MTKLVRDLVPRLSPGSYVKVDRDTLCSLLEYKLVEEVVEFFSARSMEELANIVEVVEGLAKCFGRSLRDVLELRERKRVARGGFEEGYVLIE